VKFEPKGEEFEPFALVCLIAAGRLPAVVEDRAVVIRMLQSGEGQELGWFRRQDAIALSTYAGILGRWAEQNREEIAEYLAGWVNTPLAESSSQLKDHAAETWEPLFAIADLAGGDWLTRITEAAQMLDAQYQHEKLERSFGERILRDIDHLVAGQDGFIGTTELTELLLMNGRSDWWVSELTPTRLARMLRGLGLRSRHNSAGTQRGFRIRELRALIAKYLDTSDSSDGSDTSKSPSPTNLRQAPERTKTPWAGDSDTKSEPPALLV
jgi:hypothetical protein